MERSDILNIYGERERLVRENERRKMTGLSRSTVWRLEREGRFPKRKQTGKNSCAWLMSDLLLWMHGRSGYEYM
ncbi:AlpA family phage regulatory protein [Salmonella enterica subsp. enterica serovar Benin]|uniref:helix-turn-helix transcriptional regulator n=1 Tax=Salmonella enterica TaxID=28901 RepID=UPI000BA1257D|nr:AlpA family phage regulatory protein [Salmonella enterica]EBV4144157.1 AlpA family phage regulatory protein [Salmonella enterica subsp. enterica serovar Benin]EIU8530954.1 AlpA family phage regulatory protein [Salmonella enterica subsp. enterica serovar Oranienburg]EBW4219073.1 AlpA family phage regulatory protein [Salmonella enterica subsp. enterica serovar Benin]ECE9228082.1 AlpA family phage regulatory protein [Salmonella enterica subsp. enterica serovar Benin]EIE1655493.1 AlpA family ph